MVVALTEIVLVVIVLAWKRLDGLDLEVYRLGAEALASSGDPYGPLPPTRDGTVLPFTYPPAAALLFLPLVLVPIDVALVALTVVSVLGIGVSAGLCFIRYDRKIVMVGASAVAVQVVALFSEPVRSTLGFGQINILLMLLVAVDLLAPMRRWPRGVLVGVAAAIKLTPIVFVLFFLFGKDRRAAVRSALAFVGCALVAGLLFPSASVKYWTDLVFASSRIGDPGYIGNQSIRGLVARSGLGNTWQTVAWIAAALLVLAATIWITRRAVAVAEPVLATCACAIGGLLMSPVSWTHHWVWGVPVLGVITYLGLRGSRRQLISAVALASVALFLFIDSPLWDHRDIWLPRESYVLTGLLLLGALAWIVGSTHRPRSIDSCPGPSPAPARSVSTLSRAGRGTPSPRPDAVAPARW
ncbi:hypothetical protein CFN78_14540 [Amycolatopsis antarctica]|uniref:Alpha-1,2-mannosyltransferase n=1 Tax=Amycolatopsis antarctica TaxID=1854586 RepID=A0A263D5X2_9PSEU|nr:glycosyltransferase 87 family protein [Amycolatopsis antarctica]OZM72866.1 hypothetical protein CFN78_14540 [Amycolatopsis antarctica]